MDNNEQRASNPELDDAVEMFFTCTDCKRLNRFLREMHFLYSKVNAHEGMDIDYPEKLSDLRNLMELLDTVEDHYIPEEQVMANREKAKQTVKNSGEKVDK